VNSTLVLPTYQAVPEYYDTLGPEVVDLCNDACFPPDPQQALFLDITFSRTKKGKSAAFENALIAGRQNLKSGAFKQAALGWLYVTEERLVIYSAHEFVNAMEMFRDMTELVTNADFLRREVKRVVRNHGEESIELLSGARLLFKTRTKGGGRGLSGRKVILDEGFALRPMHMGALLPVMSAQPDPQVIYGSSAGMGDSDVLRDIRDRGRHPDAAILDPRLAYLEWCAPPPAETCDAGTRCKHKKNAEGCGCDRPAYWLMANPAISTGRMSVDSISAERRAMPVDEFLRERMGWWDDPEGDGIIPVAFTDWALRRDQESRIDPLSAIAFGFEVSADRSVAAISIAGWREDGDIHVELVEHRPGTGWCIPRLVELIEKRKPCVVVIDPSAQAGSFEKDLRNMGFITKSPNDPKPLLLATKQYLLHPATQRDIAQGCGALSDDVTNEKIWHTGQSPLDEAMRDGRRRNISHAWGWDDEVKGDITPLQSMTLARFGLVAYGTKEPPVPFFLS
jgi:hypothetical protein